jgi:hypothetical protein
MGHDTPRIASADNPELSPATGFRLEVNLGGILNRQNVTACNRRAGQCTPPLDQPLQCHFSIGKEPTEANRLAANTTSNLANTG